MTLPYVFQISAHKYFDYFLKKQKWRFSSRGEFTVERVINFFDFSRITFCGQKHVLSFFNISIFSTEYRAFTKGRVTVLKGLKTFHFANELLSRQ
eukprot:UN21488